MPRTPLPSPLGGALLASEANAPAVVPAHGSILGWRRPPNPGAEISNVRRDYAFDILRNIMQRSIAVAAANTVHQIMRQQLNEDQVRAFAWEYAAHTYLVQNMPWLALGWLPYVSPGRPAFGTDWNAVRQECIVAAVLRYIEEDFGIDWRHAERYTANPHFNGHLFRGRSPRQPLGAPPLPNVPAPLPDSVIPGCGCAWCRRDRR